MYGTYKRANEFPPPRKPTLAELKELIENLDEFEWYIREGDVQSRCDDFAVDYRDYFEDHNIDHVILYKPRSLSELGDHCFLAIHTSDHGIVAFDPTFKQFYPHYDQLYFLDTPQAMHNYIMWDAGSEGLTKKINQVQGYFLVQAPGMELPDITVHSAFMHPSINASLAPMHEGIAATEAYVQKYKDAFAMFEPKGHQIKQPWTRLIDDERTARNHGKITNYKSDRVIYR